MTYEQILKRYWGYDSFRGVQREIIESITSGRDTLGLMPTGGGKSIAFQVPALAMEGVCIVITPLIALMKDQVERLRQIGIQAAYINSTLQHREIMQTLDNAIFGGVKLLYVSPERLSTELFLKKLKYIKLCFITVDEAHCISQWGYDFRPAYLHIADIRRIHPQTPVLALTATATPPVIDDIQRQLSFKQPNVIRMSYERKNLAYIVQETRNKELTLLQLLKPSTTDTVAEVPSAIVYVRTRRDTRNIARMLTQQGISALSYNAGLDSITRDERQSQWVSGKAKVMVATNAFGMGIDKADVRLVIHMDCPDSLEAYFQEAGRAGRDGLPAKAILLFSTGDTKKLTARIPTAFPPKEYIQKVYEHLASYYQIPVGSGYLASADFNIGLFCQYFKHFPVHVDAALKILTRAGYLQYEEDRDNQARVQFLVDRDKLYSLDYLSHNANSLIVALLRNYTGLFTDYSFINMELLANQLQLNTTQVYLILRELNDRRIISFVPQHKAPHITYTQSREETERIIIPPAVYEERKAMFEQRINETIGYLTNTNVCRSRYLLRYFGETTYSDCGLCDVCRQREIADNLVREDLLAPVRDSILQQLSDGKRHPLSELQNIRRPQDLVEAALRQLILEEQINVDSGFVFI